MKVKDKKLPGSQIELSVTLPQEDFKQYWEIAYEKARMGITIKGFRPGTAPKEMTDAAIDKDKVFNEAIQAAIRDSLREVAEDKGWHVIDQPKIDVTDADPAKGVTYTTTLTLFPEIDLGDYKKEVKKVLSEEGAKIDAITVEDDEIEKSIQWLRESRATEIAVDRPIKDGDVAEVDIETIADGKKVEGAQLERDKFVVGKSHFVPGFDEKLHGAKTGSELTFTLKAPGDYWNEELREKNIEFKVKVRGVLERVLPELNDEFATRLGPQFKSVDDVKKSIREGMTFEKQEREREKVRIALIDAVSKSAKADIPEIMIQYTLDSMVEDFRPMIEKGVKTEEDIRNELKDRARRSVLNNLVIHAIAKAEQLQPTEEEIEAVKKETPPEMLPAVDERKTHDYIYGTLLNKKVFDYLESLNEKE